MHETLTRDRSLTTSAETDRYRTSGPLTIRHDFADRADFLEYAAQYQRAFITFIGQHGREATTAAQQYEAARLSAHAIVASPRFHMQYQHHDRSKNIAMVQALFYWRDYQDILVADEVARRRDAYLRTLPPLGRWRMRRATARRPSKGRIIAMRDSTPSA